jgi:hypothetical protein
MLWRHMDDRPRGGPYDHNLVVTMPVAEAVAVNRSMAVGRSTIGRNVVVVAVNLAVAVVSVSVSADMAMMANMSMMAKSTAVMPLEVMPVAGGAVAVTVTRAMTGLGAGGGDEAKGESDGEKSFHGPDPFRWLGAGEVARVRSGDRRNPSFMSTFVEHRSKYINKKLTVSL